MPSSKGGRPVPVYFVELQTIWQELDKRRSISMVCPGDIKARQDEIVKDRIYDFLAGLDNVFDKVLSDFLQLKPLPGLEDSFACVRREAQRQYIMLGSSSAGGLPSMAMIFKALSPPILLPSVAMVSKAPSSPIPRLPRFSYVENKDALQLKGERTTRRLGVAAVVATGITPSAGSSHKSTMSHCNSSDQSISPIYQPSLKDSNSNASNLGKALISSNDRNIGWIIDSGATDHMTYDKSLFQYASFPRKDRVITANGDTVHDIQTREIIGRGTKRGGLYYVDDVAANQVLQVRGTMDDKCKKGETNVEIEGPNWFEVVLKDVPVEIGLGSSPGSSPISFGSAEELSDALDSCSRHSATPQYMMADSVCDSLSRDSIVPAHAPVDIPEVSNLDINISSNPKAIDQLPP
ncbi:hypothetical protein RHGRI_011535 [Rhododendron griersonianum]|uniref:Retrovirus-related Pol polyprotein from transposon TNT 1-94-like beta-barrel domain-containing protein n=1 Tax=Rhododendron griersonianum TaxID=479676 RepID=A0AAV6KM88_9ERIC|nr:hypothetical protein RHGRI_011535 [Rhododendron griersonianum]